MILWRALRDVEKGFYVDVGAADPEEWSVTRAFYDRGWSGINIEPLDAYFDKLTQARPRDINLKVTVGRAAGLRTLHTIDGTGLSTFYPEIAATHQAAGWQAYDTVVPVLTLTKVVEDRAAPTIHFLKIDVEGAEAEVLEGLNLDRVRPWIIVIEATEPFSTTSTRDKWEHLITDHKYSFAYFDGLSCFYVADEVSELKERLAIPPNVFDEFVRFPARSAREKVAALEHNVLDLQEREGALKAETANLRSALQAEQNQTANLRSALQAEQNQIANLRGALQAEQAQVANLHSIVQTEQAQADHLLGRVQQLEAQLAAWSHYRGVFGGSREIGDRMTGGGLRSLAKRVPGALARWAMRQRTLLVVGRTILKPFPKLTASLYRLATTPNAIGTPLRPPSSPSDRQFPDGSKFPPDLPASARPIYRRLRAALAESNAWNQDR